jgi:hypothetical protein
VKESPAILLTPDADARRSNDPMTSCNRLSLSLGLAGAAALALSAPCRAQSTDLRPADITKSVVELPAKRALAAATSVPAAGSNPKVTPGKVRWHADFAAARAAARASGKPVLLFQMMGKLDEQFC